MTVLIKNKRVPEWKTVIENIQRASVRTVNTEIGVVDITSSDGVNMAREYDPTEYEVEIDE